MPIAIEVAGVGKQFRRFHSDRPTTFQEAVTRGLRKLRPVDRFWALRDVSFRVSQGHMLGVLGHNGAGKSTLLRLLGGVGLPDAGRVLVHGRIGGLLDLGAGFHPDLTGRENVFVNGVVSGLTRKEVARRFDDIVAFAELEAAIDDPLRTYSSGMRMRLGFAVAVHTDPDVLLIDEVLAVGDMAFRQKCLERIREFKSKGLTIVLVSHEPEQVRQFCDEALWLRNGRMAAYGDPAQVVESYVTAMSSLAELGEGTVERPSSREDREDRLQTPLRIVNVETQGLDGAALSRLESGGALRLKIDYWIAEPLPSLAFAVSLYDSDNHLCARMHTQASGFSLPCDAGKGTLSLEFEQLDLVAGTYYFGVAASTADWQHAYDFRLQAAEIQITSAVGYKDGVVLPPHQWAVRTSPVVDTEH